MRAPVECAAMASYLPYEPMQQMLLPEALQDWLPEGHLAYFISDTVDGLDLQAFHARRQRAEQLYRPRQPHHEARRRRLRRELQRADGGR
jgi:hypothetical protein